MLRQLQAKDEALEKLQHDPCEVKISSPNSCMCHDDDFAIFENHTTRIGSKLLKKMGYEGKGLGVNGQAIINPVRQDLGMSERKLGNVPRQLVNQQQQRMISAHQFFPNQQRR